MKTNTLNFGRREQLDTVETAGLSKQAQPWSRASHSTRERAGVRGKSAWFNARRKISFGEHSSSGTILQFIQHRLRRTICLTVLLFGVAVANGAALGVGPIGLTVGDLDREVKFYTEVLPFEVVSTVAGKNVEKLTGIPAAQTKRAELKLGDERIILTEWLRPKGRPIPPDSRSFDHWFQHIAIVVRDMDAAYARLRAYKVKQVSTSPQTLPEWNQDAAGIKAFYFRDPEDHVLEIIYFPKGKGDSKWQHPTDKIFLGIDHTAIVVSDTDRSLAFYRDTLGMRVAGESENYGVEQEHLNQVFGARLRITALRAAKGPGIEFLEYITPPGGRQLPPDARANDLIFWQTQIEVDSAVSLKGAGASVISDGVVELPGGAKLLVRDPDGHALQFTERDATKTSRR